MRALRALGATVAPAGPRSQRSSARYRFRLDLHRAVDVGFETGTQKHEPARELEVVHDLPVEDLTRDQERNTRRVRRDQTGGDAAFELIDGVASVLRWAMWA